MSRYRVAVVASHPIQYHAPWFRGLAEVVDLEVFFCHRQDGAGQAAAGFGVEFEWDVPLLDGYSHTWLTNRSRKPDVSSFTGCDTPDIADRLERGGFDACIVSGWYLKSYVQAIRACRRCGIPVLVRGDSWLGTSRSAVRTAVKYVPYRWLLTHIDAFLYVGKANREYLRHYGVPESRLFFSPHFVDNAFFASRARVARESDEVRQVRATLGIPMDATVYAFGGKLVENKRVADFVRAVDAARHTRERIWGMVIGSGPLEADLKQLTADLSAPVRFAGFQNQTALPRFLAAADAVVLPSQSETWGLIVNEAMACGLPAIVSTGTGCAADLIAGGTGAIFQTGNIRELTGALLRLDDALATNRPAIRQALESKLSQYSCETAVRGAVEALESMVRSDENQTVKTAQRPGRAGLRI